jgi:Glutamine amidotransferase class-I
VSNAVRIGILGDFNPKFRSHPATTEALQHAAHKLDLKLDSEWIPTPSLTAPGAEKILESFDGLWGSPGSPYKSFDGMLKGIEFARRRDWPYLGTCGGFQYALIEFARNVLGIADADTAENNSGSKNIVIYPVACAVTGIKGDAPKLSGKVPEIRLRPVPTCNPSTAKTKKSSPKSSSATSKSTPSTSGPPWKPAFRSWRAEPREKYAPSSPLPTASSSRLCSNPNSPPPKKSRIP